MHQGDETSRAGTLNGDEEPSVLAPGDARPDDWASEREAAYADALGDVSKHIERKEQDAEARAIEAAEGPSTARTVATWIGLVAAVAVLVLHVLPPIAITALAAPRPYAVGAMGDGDEPDLDAVVAGLWEVRGAMDRYLYAHAGKSPTSLAALEDAPQTCPGSGLPWAYERIGETGYRVMCPSPATLGREAIFLDHRLGPPQVSLRPRKGE